MWTDDMIYRLLDLKKKTSKTYKEMGEIITDEFGEKKTGEACKSAYKRYKDIGNSNDDMMANLRERRSAQKRSSKNAKQVRTVLDYLEEQQDLKEALDEMLKTVRFTKPKVPKKPRKDKKKRDMTTEHMLTDLHYGKLTDEFNYDVARQRMQKLSEVTLGEFDRYSKLYNIEQSIVFLGGDIIEGATIHGTESRMGSEAGNADQIKNAIYSLYEDYLVPVLSYGHKVKVVAISGNHDRDGQYKTYSNPGKENFTWVIYHTLKHLCKVAGFKNVEFVIPEGVYHIEEVYGSKVLYEHGDNIKGQTKNGYESHMAKRGVQNDCLIDFFRVGHIHERKEYGRGRIIVNPSLPGQDSYSEINGYSSEAAQTINYYVKTKRRSNPFYHSFCCYLGDE
jgi:predicted phosphodiesterase